MDENLIQRHLESFVSNFVVKAKQDRVREKLLKLDGEEWDSLAPSFRKWLELSKCRELLGQEAFPHNLSKKFGDAKGIYFDFKTAPSFLTLEEAASIHFKDALFSLEAGALVFLFTHDDERFVCA